MEKLLEISSKHPDPVNANPPWLRKNCGLFLCKKCNRNNRSQFPLPINIELMNNPGHKIFDIVVWTGISIFHIKLIDQIESYLKDFVIGKCIDKYGKIIKDYVTCYSKEYIVVRGDKNSRYWICEECGTISQSGWSGPQYIPRYNLTHNLIYQNNSGQMYIEEELALQLDFSFWPDVDLRPIGIRDKTIDGQVLPCDPLE